MESFEQICIERDVLDEKLRIAVAALRELKEYLQACDNPRWIRAQIAIDEANRL